jgi:CheY-like chemotaxis protein
MNVLLVDDDAVCNLICRKILQKTGLVSEIDVAMNGEEALNVFNDCFTGTRSQPDIILLDLNMPVMDGFSFIEAFKKMPLVHKSKTRIIILSSSIDPRDMQKAKAMGVDHYLSKPISEEKLMAALIGA